MTRAHSAPPGELGPPPTGGSGGKPPIERGHRLPGDWAPDGFQPDTVAHKIAAEMDPMRLRWELERFVAYWTAKPGRKARKCDWQSAWVHWILNTRRYGRRQGDLFGGKG